MKIEHIITEEKYGGLSRYATGLYTALNKYGVHIHQSSPIMLFGCPISLKRVVTSDVVHFTNQEVVSPLVTPNAPWVVTVHDLTVIKMNLFKASKARFKTFASLVYNFKISCLKNAPHIIAVSQYTQNDLVNKLGINNKKISVIYEGVDHSFKPIKNVKKQKNTVVYVGNELPHKNVVRLLQAIALVKKKIPTITLVKIGMPGWEGAREELLREALKLGIEKRILFKENVEDLAREYTTASVLVLPSLYEGFGLPILEAMSCGCPVITSNVSSMPEIAGEAALLIDPYDPSDLAQGIETVLTRASVRNDLIHKGFKRIKAFTWEKTARETLGVYKEVLKQRSVMEC